MAPSEKVADMEGRPNTNRPRGFLTESDREFLLNENKDEMPDGTVYSKRHRIRKRATHGLLDLYYLYLIGDDLEEVFNNSEFKSEQKTAFQLFIESAAKWWGEEITELIGHGLWQAAVYTHVENGYFTDPSVSVDISYRDGMYAVELQAVKEEIEQANNYEDLSEEVLWALLGWPEMLPQVLEMTVGLPEIAPGFWDD